MISKQKICGIEFDVTLCNPSLWSGQGVGRTSFKDGLILINSEMKKEIVDQTNLHEVVHAILDMNGFCDDSANEALVSVLSNCLYSYIKENPEVIKGWLS